MKWVTRQRAKVDRVACPWLILNFIDPQAEFIFAPADQVREVAEREGAIPFDAPGVKLGHHHGHCSFESILAEYQLTDPALQKLARIVHGADIPADLGMTPQSAGLRAIAEGWDALGWPDQRRLEIGFVLYDGLYAWCRAQIGSRESS
ncbi:MAG: chromate resistance protein [Chloroflexi bacterium]|nr:chromate resistance protein [Chloroflexota bacterium]